MLRDGQKSDNGFEQQGDIRDLGTVLELAITGRQWPSSRCLNTTEFSQLLKNAERLFHRPEARGNGDHGDPRALTGAGRFRLEVGQIERHP
jgi:hypothetical protein